MKEFILKSNTDLCMDIKTILHSDSISKIGRDYQGVLTRDTDEHYTFIETIPPVAEKRNPQVFKGKFITVTRNSNGTYRPNFKPMPQIGATFSVDYYVFEVYRELRQALMGLIEK